MSRVRIFSYEDQYARDCGVRSLCKATTGAGEGAGVDFGLGIAATTRGGIVLLEEDGQAEEFNQANDHPTPK
ncbi:hypothetical protein KQX54_004540 [Cotesia glomerata]|uniref:Uncharacterized protein n=1 Tax=Cotesia glomerata TaxID=32391 RepID=A0AAV7J5E6_COTGL|nr:hypothetical protein KQX54_004540 [Cotesia glomerata]